ncbi:hypothetical protein GCM10020219_060970 [Nonomuraea dietziae]
MDVQGQENIKFGPARSWKESQQVRHSTLYNEAISYKRREQDAAEDFPVSEDQAAGWVPLRAT